MATGYNGSQISEIKENSHNKKFAVGDQVAVAQETALPKFNGTIEKKYTNSALVSFTAGDAITKQMVEDFNGKYVVSYGKLKKIKAAPAKTKTDDAKDKK